MIHATLSQKTLHKNWGWWSGSGSRPLVQTPIIIIIIII
jgi:hypothetical protein